LRRQLKRNIRMILKKTMWNHVRPDTYTNFKKGCHPDKHKRQQPGTQMMWSLRQIVISHIITMSPFSAI